MASLKEVEELIKETISKIKSESDLSKKQGGEKFEEYVVEVMKKCAETEDISVSQTGKQTFPDIVIDGTYGVEVKYSKSKKWQSTGNSIFEGTLRDGVTDQIFLLFGKEDGTKIDVRYKKYEDVLADIKVTHSPRFYIDMDVKEEDTILHKIDLGYDEFKSMSSKVKSNKIKEFVRTTLKEGEELWWLDSEEDEDIAPKVKQLKSLKASERDEMLSECMVLFPEIFTFKGGNKYQRTAVYLLKKYQIVSSSLRDNFSAKGKFDIVINGKQYKLPRIYEKLFENARLIEKYLNDFDTEVLSEYWNIDFIPKKKDVKQLWANNLDNIGNKEGMNSEINPSDIFKEGLKENNYFL